MREEILDKHPKATLHVYVVWFNMLPGEAKIFVDRTVLGDPRVTNFWDEGKVTGRWLAQHVTGEEGIVWDAYFLYGPEAHWDSLPGPLLSSGGSVLGSAGQLQQSIEPLLRE